MTEGGTILEARGLCKSFKSPSGGVIEVLRGVDISIRRGESISLTGESGAGKTTFMNICAALERAGGGEVHWDGGRVDNLSNRRQALLRARFMGFVFQSCCLVPELNALENVLLAPRIAGLYNAGMRLRAREILDATGLKDRFKHLPGQLSGGERQRVAIARALVNSPRLILADEPTGNLDEATGEEIMAMLLRLCSENSSSLLLITHNPDFAARTQRRAHMAKGLIDSQI